MQHRQAILLLATLLLLVGGVGLGQAALPPEWRFYKALEAGDLDFVKQAMSRWDISPNWRFNGSFYHNVTPLMVAAKRGHVQVVQFLLDAGAEINAQDDLGMTALMYATQAGQIPVVQALLKRGADIKVKNRQGETALDLAEKLGYKHVFGPTW